MNNHLHKFGSRLGSSALSLRLVLIVGAAILLSLFAHWFELNISQVEIWIKSLGTLAPLAFILLFVITSPFFLSVDARSLVAGVLFPLPTGGFYIVISTDLAADRQRYFKFTGSDDSSSGANVDRPTISGNFRINERQKLILYFPDN